MKKILLYEVIKLLVAFGGCILSFSLLPISLYVLLLPVDVIGWFFLRSRVSASVWIGSSVVIYLATVIFCFVWILSGHTELEFLLDVDWMR